MNNLIQTLSSRGFLHQLTHPQDLDSFCEKPTTAYVGFDATADSLQVGNLMMLMLANWFQRYGHRMILLVGGGTTKIGDPSGRDKARQLLDEDQIRSNIEGLRRDINRVVSFKNERALLVNNADWFDKVSYIPFLRDIGLHFSMNRLLSFDYFKSRLDQDLPLSFIEINYPLMQAYDFLELFRSYDCRIQFGGSDQWSNIVSGVDLVRRVTGQSVFGMTCPLLVTSSGQKMGKTAQGAIWLNPSKTSAYDYWQFWRNTADEDVIKFLKLYTFLPLEQIEAMQNWQGQALNDAKILLADEATRILHGHDIVNEIKQTVESIFSAVDSVSQSDIAALPVVKIPLTNLTEGISVLNILKQLDFVDSLSEGRRKIREGAVKCNGKVIHEETHHVFESDFMNGCIVVSLGQKKYGKILIATAPEGR